MLVIFSKANGWIQLDAIEIIISIIYHAERFEVFLKKYVKILGPVNKN